MTNRNWAQLSKLSLALAFAFAAAPVFAQNTSSAVAGRISGVNNQAVSGADVTIVHEPSGTVSHATTGADGRYIARGLRVGGPYTITITKDGKSEKREGVYLQLAETSNVDASIGVNATELAVVEVVGTAVSNIFNPTNMGTGTNVTRAQIEALPSTGRNIQDYIRLDPRVSQVSKADGAISAGGQNTRFNAIRIDGVSTADPFGLESNNLPTERQPVSLDAIEEIKIDLANYDVTSSGGTGAVINAVTKSGTNEYKGSVYYTYRDKDMVRKELNGVKFNGFNSEKTYGGTFGGPLIKDRLFFFANYEKYTRSAPGTSLTDTPFGRGQITDANIADAIRISKDKWGFDAGALSLAGSNDTEIEEYAIKLDWNITDSQRASLRYSKLDQTVLRFPLISSSQVSLSSAWYNQPKQFESYVGELFSDWTENFSTEAKVSYRDYTAVRDTLSNLPQIRVRFGNQSLFFGTEQNSHVNIVDTTQWNAFLAGNLYLDDHTVKFGFDYEKNDIINFFGRNLNGVYDFPSLAAFEAGTPSNYIVRTPRPGRTVADIPASFTQTNTGVFVQDSWAVNANLNLMFGLRLDAPDFKDTPLRNDVISTLYGFDNTNTLDTKLWQPRFGFNYTFDSELPTQLRGGVGLFQGAAPNVWLAGTFQNTGLNSIEFNVNNPGAIFTPNIDPPFVPSALPGGTPRQNVDIAEPGLALPSVWKANVAFEKQLPYFGLVASAELLLTETKDAIYFNRLDISAPTAVGPDGRLIYWNAAGRDPSKTDGTRGIQSGTNGANNRANRPSNVGDVMLARNTDLGNGQQLTVSLSLPKKEHWSWTLGYTYTDATEVSPLTSSQNTSNWNNTPIFQANENVAYDSRYAIRDRFTGVLGYENNFFGDNKTSVSLFYEGRSGRPFSYIFFNDVNGDSAATNDLFYVPNGPGDVLFTGGAAMEQKFFDFLAQTPDLARFAGKVVPANSGNAGFVHSFDVRLSQEIPSFFNDNKIELTLDIMNIGNLLNRKWGLIDDYGFFSTRRVANYSGICSSTVTAVCPAGSEGKYVYTFTSPDETAIQENNNDKGNTGVSRWSVQVGFRYKF